MSVVGFKGKNHPQQVGVRGSREDIDDRAIHPTDFAPLLDRFSFTVDVAAAAHNARCARYYDVQTDGLSQSWAGESVWCNPPYSDIAPWIRKAWQETDARTVVMLLPPNRTEQQWWQLMVEPYRDRVGSPLSIEFLPGRMRFLKREQDAIGPNERPPFGCLLAIWKPLAWTAAGVPDGGLFGGAA